MRKSYALAILLVLCALILSACGGAERLSFPKSVMELDVGSACRFEPEVYPKAAGKIDYSVSDCDIAEYIGGIVFAKRVGECTLYAACGDASAEVFLRVRDYRAEAAQLKAAIAEAYESGNLNAESAAEFCRIYDGLDEAGRKAVKNIETARIYSRTASDTVWVYISESGEKYHSADCGEGGAARKRVPLDFALSKGREPCSRCH